MAIIARRIIGALQIVGTFNWLGTNEQKIMYIFSTRFNWDFATIFDLWLVESTDNETMRRKQPSWSLFTVLGNDCINGRQGVL